MIGRFDFMDYFAMVFIFIMVLFTFLIAGIFMDKISITFQKDYQEKYNECISDLERTSPICPVCKCSSNTTFSNNIFWFTSGFMLMFIIYDFVLLPRFVRRDIEKYVKSTQSKSKAKGVKDE